MSYVRHTATIVFDGYNNLLSTKTNAPTRRSPIRCQDIVINESNIFHPAQETYLSKENNKTCIITLIFKYLDKGDQLLIQCDEDADPTVISVAISLLSSKKVNPVMVVADDTDIAIMHIYHWNGEMSEIIFNSKKLETAWSKPSARSNLEDKEHLLFLHAWSCCNAVPATFPEGKTSFLKLVNQSAKRSFHINQLCLGR